MKIPGCKVKTETITRIEVVGLMESRQKVLDQLYEAGFSVKRCGPYTDERMHPNFDGSRFLFVAEKIEE